MRWALLLLASCATVREPPPRCETVPFEIFVEGGEVLNVNVEGQSLPVEVRAYFLSARDRIENTDFESLWQRPEEALGPSLLASTTFTVFPGAEKITTVQAPPATGFLAIVGLFREIEGDQWRRVVDVRKPVEKCKPGGLHTAVRASVRDNRVVAPERVE